MSEWISVKDRLPDPSDGTVLVCMPNQYPFNNKEPYPDAKHDQRVCTACYSGERFIYAYGGVNPTEPEYWMPLPEPPTM